MTAPPAPPHASWAPRPAPEPAAIAALVLALLSFLLPVAPAVAALALVPGARRNIAASGGRHSGAGLIRAAQILSALTLLLASLGMALLARS